MNLENIPLPLTGKTLVETLKSEKVERRVIAEGFLYEKTCLMVSSDPGVGKSTIALQIAMELAGGLPVFGYFHTPSPIKVLYIQWERNIIESLERIKTMSKTIPLVSENLVLTNEYQRLNLLKPEHADLLLQCINRDCPKAKVIIFDPIYATIPGGLKDDKQASMFNRAISLIEKELEGMLYLNHHTTKAQYTRDGAVIDKDDPFYGSQWLKAHITGSYHVKKTGSGVIMSCKKDTYALHTREIRLKFNPETEICEIEDYAKTPALDRVRHFIRMREIDKKEFTFEEIQGSTLLCTRTLREALVHTTIEPLLNYVTGSKNKKIYTVKGG